MMFDYFKGKRGYSMHVKNGFVFSAVIMAVFINLQAYSIVGESIKLKDNDFFSALADSDVIFVGKYLRGGRKKAKVEVKDVISGKISDSVVIEKIDEQKYHRKYRKPQYKSGEKYVFIVNKKGNKYELHEDSVSIPVMKNSVNFSFISPYFSNFWQIHDMELFKIAIKGIKEKKDGVLSTDIRNSIRETAKDYYEKKNFNSLEIIIHIAKMLSVQLDEEMYEKLVNRSDNTGCLSVKYSTNIMGDTFFREKILKKIDSFSSEKQAAAADSVLNAGLKDIIPELGKIIKKSESATLPRSSCFPHEEYKSNKAAIARAIIEVNADETSDILLHELNNADHEWAETLLEIMSDYVGEDLVEIGLKGAVEEKNSRKRMIYSEYFDRIKSPETAKTLMNLFEKNSDRDWRKLILSTLGKYEYKPSLKFMIDKLKNSMHEEVRATAAMSLGKLNSPEAIEPLYKFIMSEKSILSKSIGIDALAEIRDQKVQEYLKKIIKEAKKSKVREAAAQAIEDNIFILRYGRKK